MSIIFGSARIDERGKTAGGAAGDQTGNEVSTQPFYMHEQGWYALRPKSADHAAKIASAMQQACDNNNIGYDQYQRGTLRTAFLKYGSIKDIPVACECDCSALVRVVILQATGKDVGDIYTGNLASALETSELFEKRFSVTSEGQLYNGDVLVTKGVGHTVVVVSGRSRSTSTGNTGSTGSTAPSNSWKAIGTATCTANSVNVRSGPGMQYSSYGQLNAGNRFEVDGKEVDGWVHLKVKLAGADVYGYMYKEYVKFDSAGALQGTVKIDSAKSRNDSLAGTYRVINTGGEGLSLRAGAGVKKKQLAVIPDGGTCKNYGFYTSSGGFNWLYVTYKDLKGFVCDGGYLEKL